MSTLTLLLPPRARLALDAAIAASALARWLTRGDRLPDAAPGREAAIRELFQFAGTAIPVAALTRQADCADATGATWLRADPAYVRADMATARLLVCGDMGLTLAECGELLRPLKPLFGDSGFPIEAPVPSRWYLRAPPGAQLPVFVPPERVLGDDLRLHLPEGNEGRRWRSLLNEAQILLHNHPLNQTRAERGLMPVNSLWFWGAGSLPDWVKTSLSHVQTRDAVLAALAQRANVSAAEPQTTSRLPDTGLIDLDDARGLSELASHWLPAIETDLGAKRWEAVRLNLASGERVVIKPAHRWRFWRRVQAVRA